VVQRVWTYAPQIGTVAARFDLPPEVLAGLVCQESQGNTWAARPEPYYRWLFGGKASTLPLLKRLLPRWRTPKQDYYMQRVSWGLCQVMGAVAREAGLAGNLTRLCDPMTGLHYGAKHLALCRELAGGDLFEGLRRYNGNPKSPRTAQYAGAVMDWSRHFEMRI
jgi:hypothetical protein